MPIHPDDAEVNSLARLLLEREIEFILVGGAAALIHGSPLRTRDFDAVHHRTPSNVDRLHKVLLEIDAFFRNDVARRRLVPTIEHLLGTEQLLLSTRPGPLDLLGTLHDGRGYDELLPHTVTYDVGGRSLRVLDVPTLIEVKTAAGRTKDKLAVIELLAILDRQLGKKQEA